MKHQKLMKINATPCFTPKQIYAIEKNWFKNNDSFGLMQQASWQMANWLKSHFSKAEQSVLVVVGNGNNGGDGWLVATYLRQLCQNWTIKVLEIAEPTTDDSQKTKNQYQNDVVFFRGINDDTKNDMPVNLSEFLQPITSNSLTYHFDIIIDGLFGIGLDRQPTGNYGKIIDWINAYRQQFHHCQVVSIDVPSGLNATTGEVYYDTAIRADVTLCLIARKIGLHLYQSKDYVGQIIDLTLIPVTQDCSIFYHKQLPSLSKRPNHTHKGSYGHVLIIGGNQLESGNGMAGASLLSASCAFAVGLGKVTVACHRDFHSAIITNLPNAMTADLHHVESVCELIKNVDVVAIGMGLGRDENSFQLFDQYLNTIVEQRKTCVIDADGLYHLANWQNTVENSLSKNCNLILGVVNGLCYLTPHSAEAGRLLDQSHEQIDKDKIKAIRSLSEKYGGNWLIKGSQTIVSERFATHICGLGNAGMATAGMGDCLAGVIAGLLAQQDMLNLDYPLLTATLIHAKAGDELAKEVGEYVLSAKDMADKLGQVIKDCID